MESSADLVIKMNASSPKVTVIIPNWNGEKWLPDCLKGLYNQAFKNFETIFVDNGSTDKSVAFVKENYPQVQIISLQENRGFATAVNAGIRASRSDYIALLNNDTNPQPHWLS